MSRGNVRAEQIRFSQRSVPEIPTPSSLNDTTPFLPQNDHAPVFLEEVYEVTASELSPPGTRLAALKATDADEGRNAAVRLSVAAGNEEGKFRLDPRTGVLYVAGQLDAEARSGGGYALTVSALDQANAGARRQSSARVRVTVRDENDNAPTFGPGKSGRERTVSLEENQPMGARAARLEAADADAGDNGRVSYSLANVNPVPFEVDANTGVVTATRLLDYETDRREWRLVVRASDWGRPFRRQAELRLTVRLRDANDNRPQFERADCRGRVPRDTPVGGTVFALSALDFDAGDVVSYRFVSGNADGCFALDPARGVVSVVCDLRTLPERRRELNVTATDGQHFADVTPLVMEFVEGGGSSSERRHQGIFSQSSSSTSPRGLDFECRETGVAGRMMEALTKSQRANNPSSMEEDPAWAASVSAEAASRPGLGVGPVNVHRPEFDARLPRAVAVNETAEIGTVLLKVGHETKRNESLGNFLASTPERWKK